jgi:hypothetical protein
MQNVMLQEGNGLEFRQVGLNPGGIILTESLPYQAEWRPWCDSNAQPSD